MTDLITAEEAKKLLDREGDYTDQSLDCASDDLARTVIALHAQLADAQAAQAMVIKKLNREPSLTWIIENTSQVRIRDLAIDMLEQQRALASIDGLALARELRDRAEKAEAERDIIRADRDSAARMWQASEQEREAAVARSREASQMLAIETQHAAQAEAERDTLAAANAVLEAKVAGLVDALEPSAETKAAYMGEFYMGVTMSHPRLGEETRKVQIPWTTIKEVMAAIRARAALATQEAGNG